MTAEVSYDNAGSLSDEVLTALFNGGNQTAFAVLADRYLWLIRAITSKYNISGLDAEDLTQEGLLGLLCAVKTYRADKGAQFRTYASLCVNRRIIALLEHSKTNKSKTMDNYVPIGDSGEDLSALIEEKALDPEELYIAKENLTNLRRRIAECLSKREKSVFDLYIAGESYSSIGESLDMSAKSVDNALQRIRRKLKKQFSDIPI